MRQRDDEQRDDAFWRHLYKKFCNDAKDGICIEEYKNASYAILAEEKNFTAMFGFVAILLSIITGTFTIFLKDIIAVSLINNYVKLAICSIASLIYMLIIFCAIYFANRQKEIVLSKRKLVILRGILGLNYFDFRAILPTNSEAGATNPFNIKLFQSFFSKSCFPIQVLTTISFTILFILFLIILKEIYNLTMLSNLVITFSLSFMLSCIIFFIYRLILLENNENLYLIIVKCIAILMRVRLVGRFEYIIYRAYLSAKEINRIGIDSISMHKLLIAIEDREFYTHYGVNIKRTIRAFLGILPLINIFYPPSGGGSSITQQLVRTLFIENIHKKFRRKIIEILLALWLNKIWTKSMQLDIYLAAVRFENGIFGINKGMEYFFNDMILKPSNSQIFFLIERVANINSALLTNKIKSQIRYLISTGLITKYDINELISIYTKAVADNKINTTTEKLVDLTNFLQEQLIVN